MNLSTRHAFFAAYCLLVALVNWPVLWALAELGTEDVTASHHVLIPVVSTALVYLRRRSIFRAAQLESVSGVVVIASALCVWLFAGSTGPGGLPNTLIPNTAALIMLWVGGFLLFYGRTAFRFAIFPLLFLIFMVPIPRFVLDPTVWFLKVGSAEVVSGLFHLTGTRFYRDGFHFTLPTVAIEIADECSGIRSSIGLVVAILVVAHLFLKTGWKKALLLSMILPLSVLKNGIRIVSLVLLSIHVDPGFLTGGLHHQGGSVFLLLALSLLAPLVALLSRSELPDRGRNEA